MQFILKRKYKPITSRFVSQVREAYLHFMVSIAKITRDDKNLTQDDERVLEEMMQVLKLETDIANVSEDVDSRK